MKINEIISYAKYSDKWKITSISNCARKIYIANKKLCYMCSILIVNYMDEYQIVKNRCSTIQDKDFIVIRYEDLFELSEQDILDILLINKNIIIKYDIATQLLL